MMIKVALLLLSMVLSLEAIPLSAFFNGPLASFIGRCPSREPKESFNGEDLKKLVGRWHKYSSNVPEIFGLLLKCSNVVISEFENTNNYYNFKDNYYLSLFESLEYGYEGTLEQDDPDTGKFDYTTLLPLIKKEIVASFQVIATDRKDYAILSICKEFTSYYLHLESLVVLTKDAVVSDSVQKEIDLAIYNYLPSEQNNFHKISQSDCQK